MCRFLEEPPKWWVQNDRGTLKMVGLGVSFLRGTAKMMGLSVSFLSDGGNPQPPKWWVWVCRFSEDPPK